MINPSTFWRKAISIAVIAASSVTTQASIHLETIVVTATRQPVDANTLPDTIAVVDKANLQIIAHRHINEALSQVAGAWVSRGNGQEHLTAIRSPSYTGAGACGEFLISENGVPLRPAGFCNVNQLFEVNSEQAEKIEVLNGPGASVHGSNAVHGVINVITQPNSYSDDERIGVEFGPHSYNRIKAELDSEVDNHGVQLTLHHEHDGGYKDSSGFDQTKLNLSHRYSSADWQVDTVFSATDLDQDTAGYLEGFEVYKDEDLKEDNPNPEAYRKASAHRLSSRFTTELGQGVQLEITPYLRHSEMEFLQHFVPWQPVEKNGQTSFGLQTGATYAITESSTIFTGVDIEYAQGWLEEFQAEPFDDARPQGFHYDYEVDAYTIAPYAQLTTELTEQWVIHAGVRYETNHYDYNNKLSDGSACDAAVTNCRFTRPTDQDDSFDNLSPNIGAVYSYANNHSVYAKWSNGFRAPQTTELYRLQNGQNIADIDSVELESSEIGFKGSWDSVSYSVSLFDMDKSNIIFQDSNRNNVDNGESTHRGIELSTTIVFNSMIDFSISGTLAEHEYANNIAISDNPIEGNEIVTAPKQMANSQLGFNITDNSRVMLEMVYMGDYYLDADNSHEYDGHTLFNVNGRWQLTGSLLLTAHLTNLTDEDYAERARFNFGDYQYFVGEPRSIYLGAEYSF